MGDLIWMTGGAGGRAPPTLVGPEAGQDLPSGTTAPVVPPLPIREGGIPANAQSSRTRRMNRAAMISIAWRARLAVVGAVAAGVLLLPACQIPKSRQADPGAPLPQTFGGQATPDNSALLRLDEFFD